MPKLEGKPRSWEAYLAGFRASGLLTAGALVMFVILIGVITLKTWPRAGDLLPGGGHDASLTSAAKPAPQSLPESTGLNLVSLLGAPAGSTGSPRGPIGGTADPGNGLTPGDGGGDLGGSPTQPGAGGGQPQGAEPPPSESQPQPPSNAVSDVVSGAGNTVESTTKSLGDALGGSSSPGLGGVLGGLGRTLNNDLQSLAGKN